MAFVGLLLSKVFSANMASLNAALSKKSLGGIKVWEVIGLIVGGFIVIILMVLLYFCLTSRKKSRRHNGRLPVTQIPTISKEIKEISVSQITQDDYAYHNGVLQSLQEKFNEKEKDSDKLLVQPAVEKTKYGDANSQSDSFTYLEKEAGGQSGDEECSGKFRHSPRPTSIPSPLSGLPEFSQLGWGHWFTLRDLEVATERFSKENIIGEGGYGVVYRGELINGSPVAVKRILNNVGQAEKEFRVEVEAIGHVRHKNLVRLLGYCIEGTHRLLVYEYVNNGNLEQWLHGAMSHHGYLTWEARSKILTGTAKAYVAPEYANSGMLNEKSDIYSFGVLLLEAITGRDPVDYSRPANEVNLVDWLKNMVGNRRSEEVIDPKIETRPSTRALKRTLLTALRCVDPDSEKRPTMSQVVRMLESEEYPISREDRRHRKSNAESSESHQDEFSSPYFN
ncbi:hypothetical protein V2J09_001943 [Rumex salicifolius]